MKILSRQANYINLRPQRNGQKFYHSQFPLQQDTVCFGMAFGDPYIKKENYREGASNVVINGDFLVNSGNLQYRIGSNVKVRGEVESAPNLFVGKNFTADSLLVNSVTIDDNLNVGKIKSFGDVKLGSINSLDAIALFKRQSRKHETSTLTLPSKSMIVPDKIIVYLGDFKGIDVVTPDGNKDIFDKLEFVDMESTEIIDPKSNPNIKLLSKSEYCWRTLEQKCSEFFDEGYYQHSNPEHQKIIDLWLEGGNYIPSAVVSMNQNFNQNKKGWPF